MNTLADCFFLWDSRRNAAIRAFQEKTAIGHILPIDIQSSNSKLFQYAAISYKL